MKTLIASLMALSLSLGTASATDSVTAANRKQTEVVANAHSISLEVYNQLLAENKFLRSRVAQLADSTAELQSTLEYNEVMSRLLMNLKQQQYAEQQAELDAQASYNQLMGQLLLKLKQPAR